jgi:hypothetical protein
MKSTDHLHQQIARATSRLAQLQAQELVVEQRKAVRARAEARRASERRRRRLAELVIEAGAQDLPDEEIVAVLKRAIELQEPHFELQRSSIHIDGETADKTEISHRLN